jgi:hypothetical protein
MIQKLQFDTGVRAGTAAVVIEQQNGPVTTISRNANGDAAGMVGGRLCTGRA